MKYIFFMYFNIIYLRILYNYYYTIHYITLCAPPVSRWPACRSARGGTKQAAAVVDLFWLSDNDVKKNVFAVLVVFPSVFLVFASSLPRCPSAAAAVAAAAARRQRRRRQQQRQPGAVVRRRFAPIRRHVSREVSSAKALLTA